MLDTSLKHFFDFQFLEQKGKALVVLSDENGFILVLSNPKAFKGQGEREILYPEAFHFGFLVETPSEVDQAYDRLLAHSNRQGTLFDER